MESRGMPGHLIRRLQQYATQTFQTHMHAAGFDITPVQFATLDALWHNPGIDQASVSALISYDRVTIGGVIDRLVGKGLVLRKVSERDRRARVLALTPEGDAVFGAVLPVVREAQDKILSGLAPEERVLFLRLAARVVPGDLQHDGAPNS